MTDPSQQPKVINQDKESRTWVMLCHLTALLMFLGVPFGNLLGPFVVWLLKKNELPAVDIEGKASLNFQITMTIAMIVAGLLCLVLIGIPILIGLIFADVLLVITAAVKTSNGEEFKYPWGIAFIK